MNVKLKELCKKHSVDYILVSFMDLFGVIRSKLVPAAAADACQKDGAGFAGFAAYLDMTPADPDMLVMPDPQTFTVLPWKRDLAWVTGDVVMDGKMVEHAPRNVLKRVREQAGSEKFQIQTGVEAEFFVLSPDGTTISDPHDQLGKPCYDQLALMRRFELIKEICDSMQTLGWEPYQNDHEDANGQFEMNWKYSDSLTTADRHTFFRFMAKAIAEKHGLRITFMPKPFEGLTGNGCHAHISVWNTNGTKNIFKSASGELGLSEQAYHFLGGILGNAKALCALTNPTVNSYKRIHAPVTVSGATWSPNTISYTGNNRTHMIRIPAPDRFELRLADGAANPYLLQAGIVAAGLEGMKEKIEPGRRLDNNMYDSREGIEVDTLPANLFDALNCLEQNEVFSERLGQGFISSFIKQQRIVWNDYMGSVSDWERKHTLDC